MIIVEMKDKNGVILDTEGKFCEEPVAVVLSDELVAELEGGGIAAKILGTEAIALTAANIDGCTSIRPYALYQHTGLTSIELPDTVESIGENACCECTNLITITIGKNSKLKTIGAAAFKNAQLTNAKVFIPAGVTSIGKEAFYHGSTKWGLKEVEFATNSQLQSIGAHAFSNRDIEYIIIPDSVTTIGENAFYQCRSLDFVALGKGVTSIGNSAFISCPVTTLDYAGTMADWLNITFGNQRSNPIYVAHALQIDGKIITNFVVPAGATIKAYAFYGGTAFKKFTLPATPPTLANKNAFTDISDDCVFEIPAGSLSAYTSATNWSAFASRFVEV